RLDLTKRRGSIARYLFEYLAFLALATFYLSYLHLKRRFQIIHVHNMPDALVFCALMPWMLGAKVILDVHDPMTELFASIYGLPVNHWLIKLIGLQEKISYAFPYLVITINESMRERLL